VDLKRDVIKSDTASVEVPELELELSHGSLGGVYTTVRVTSPPPLHLA
jgi:zinc finger protein